MQLCYLPYPSISLLSLPPSKLIYLFFVLAPNVLLISHFYFILFKTSTGIGSRSTLLGFTIIDLLSPKKRDFFKEILVHRLSSWYIENFVQRIIMEIWCSYIYHLAVKNVFKICFYKSVLKQKIFIYVVPTKYRYSFFILFFMFVADYRVPMSLLSINVIHQGMWVLLQYHYYWPMNLFQFPWGC